MVMAFHSASLAVWSSCRVLRQLAAQFVLRRAVERILSLAGAWRLQDGEILVRARDSAQQQVPVPRGWEVEWVDALDEFGDWLSADAMRVLRWTRAQARCWADRYLYQTETFGMYLSLHIFDVHWAPPGRAFFGLNLMVARHVHADGDSGSEASNGEDPDPEFEDVQVEEQEEMEEVEVEVEPAFDEVSLFGPDGEEFEEIEVEEEEAMEEVTVEEIDEDSLF